MSSLFSDTLQFSDCTFSHNARNVKWHKKYDTQKPLLINPINIEPHEPNFHYSIWRADYVIYQPTDKVKQSIIF